jgi:hypothetical protein
VLLGRERRAAAINEFVQTVWLNAQLSSETDKSGNPPLPE